MKFIATLLTKKKFFWSLLALPMLYISYQYLDRSLGVWKYSELQDYFGNTAISLLILVLCLTPLQQLFPKWSLVTALNVHRRAIGISSFLYASYHAFLYVNQSGGPTEIVRDFQEPDLFYMFFGLTGLCLLFPLFLTSNNFSMRLLTFKWWKRLHRLAYFAAFILFMHRAFGENADLFGTLLLFFPLIALESQRILRNIYHMFFSNAKKEIPHPVSAWQGERSFQIDRIVLEAEGIRSFYLKSVNKQKLPLYKAGQFLTFHFDIPGQEKPVVRCYSLSDAPGNDYYRISVKRIPPPRNNPELPSGLSSSFLHDQIQEGDVVKVLAPNGGFCLSAEKPQNIVLIGSGIGITPVLSMLNHLNNIGIKRHTNVWFFYGVRNGSEHIMKAHFKSLLQANKYLKIFICYSDPIQEDREVIDYDCHSRVSMDLLKKTLPDNNFDFYFCGPPPMMSDIAEGLEEWGVTDERIHFEAFGPATVKRMKPVVENDKTFQVKFDQTGKTLNWTGIADSILEFAEANGMQMPSGCRMGNCGSCSQKLVKGEVKYPVVPSFTPQAGYCLICSSIPVSDIELSP